MRLKKLAAGILAAMMTVAATSQDIININASAEGFVEEYFVEEDVIADIDAYAATDAEAARIVRQNEIKSEMLGILNSGIAPESSDGSANPDTNVEIYYDDSFNYNYTYFPAPDDFNSLKDKFLKCSYEFENGKAFRLYSVSTYSYISDYRTYLKNVGYTVSMNNSSSGSTSYSVSKSGNLYGLFSYSSYQNGHYDFSMAYYTSAPDVVIDPKPVKLPSSYRNIKSNFTLYGKQLLHYDNSVDMLKFTYTYKYSDYISSYLTSLSNDGYSVVKDNYTNGMTTYFIYNGWKMVGSLVYAYASSGTYMLNVYQNEGYYAITNFVERLYTKLLKRESDSAGLNDWTSKLMSNYTAADVAYGFLFSDEILKSGISNKEFVTRMYETFLGRAPDAAGLADWVDALDNGCTIGLIFNGFVRSDEFGKLCDDAGITAGSYKITETRDANRNLTAFVSRMYTKALKRSYDPTGLNDWTNRYLNQGAKVEDIAYGFIFSPEFVGKNLSDTDYIETLYVTFFNRPSDAAGRKDWLDRINNKGYSRLDVLNGFVGSQECINLVKSFGI